MAPYPKRHVYYSQRPKSAEDALCADIESWQGAPLENTIKHHIDQFYSFSTNLLKHLKQKHGGTSEADIDLRLLVVGALTSQWLLLRQVVMQRLEDSPYLASILELDREAARYYQNVRSALLDPTPGSNSIAIPDSTRESIAESTPLIHLGRMAELTFFNNQNKQAPALISVPFGVRFDPPKSRSRLSIAHEVGHAVFSRIPSFFSELSTAVNKRVDEQSLAPTGQKKALYQAIVKWIDEIVPDLVGVALAGTAFVESSLSVMAVSSKVVDFSDETHPLPIIRPYVSQRFLEYLRKDNEESVDAPAVDPLQEQIDAFSDQYHDDLFRSLPAATNIDLGTVKEEMLNLVDIVLDSELPCLGNRKFGEVLVDCSKKSISTGVVDVELSDWSEGMVNFDEPFSLDLSNFQSTEFAIPVTFPDEPFWCFLFGTC